MSTLWIVLHEQEHNVEDIIPFSTEGAARQYVHDLLLPMWDEAFPFDHWSDVERDLIDPGMADIISEKIDPPGLRVRIWECELR